MKRRRSRLLISIALLLGAAVSTGCEGEFVTTAARSSVTSFITTIATMAITQTLDPN